MNSVGPALVAGISGVKKKTPEAISGVQYSSSLRLYCKIYGVSDVRDIAHNGLAFKQRYGVREEPWRHQRRRSQP
jgi:hypothetical protein